MSHVHAFSCICSFSAIYLDIFELFLGLFLLSLSLPLSSVGVSLCLWHPNASLLCPGTLFIPRHPLRLILLLHLFSFMMRMPKRPSRRTFLDEAFILNAKSSWRTSPTLNYPLSFIVGVGSHCVTPQSHVHPCWSRSFTQHACIWFFNTSFHHSRSRYVHCCHTINCCECALCPQGRVSWLPWLWSSEDRV